ncbi:hypothetical protein [Rheinheimera maricola]|uniref:Uncharacterized protein n=1 Tax=Rheinheimera maricola TaxID=2793282 RepID=A0ABS7X8J4_9GAMM|nr:hypothetical protein [Rheinheimera maricola]MBZ9611861.1 hypothetical protein [Rheinheimera maricola]
MRFITVLLLLLLATCLAGCSDAPGTIKLKQLLQQQFDQQYDGLINIAQLEKLNGWSDSETQYIVEVSYDIEFKQSFKSYIDAQTAKPGNVLEKVASGMAAGLLKLQYGDFKAGDVYQVKQQKITLRMTENGWALTD